MQVRIKLMGMLKNKTPPGSTVLLSDGCSLRDLAGKLEISPESVQVVTVNGALKRDWDLKLNENDEIQLIPPVGGG